MHNFVTYLQYRTFNVQSCHKMLCVCIFSCIQSCFAKDFNVTFHIMQYAIINGVSNVKCQNVRHNLFKKCLIWVRKYLHPCVR